MTGTDIVVPPGRNSAPAGRSTSLKLRGGETGESVMMFEETLPAGTKSAFHLHHDSDEVAYVLSGEGRGRRKRSRWSILHNRVLDLTSRSNEGLLCCGRR